jgi:two-component system chemotaxis response regulator CheB
MAAVAEKGRRATYEIVVTASSAGGVTALGELVGRLEPGLAASVLVVQHLDPRHNSLMTDILSRRTTLAVEQAREGTTIRRATIYIAPPDHHLLVDSDGVLHLSKAELVHFLRPSADLLFESAAAAFRERLIGVVLTGTGSDGAMGVRAVKKMGGTVIVQEDADFAGMPNAARATGTADFLLPLAEIGPAINRLVAPEIVP